jgi:GNAT superfamily N-acetyltransferase
MRQPPILTTELALQLEQHIAPNETRPPEQEGSQVARFGKTIASLERAPWPPSRVFCFNAGDLDRLTEILDFFGDINPEFILVHGGFGPEVGRALNSAGYCPHDWKQTILYGLPSAQPATMPQGITIEVATPDTVEAAAEVAAEGNEWPQQWRERAKNGVRKSIHRDHLQMFLARYEGEPAGVGELSKSRAFDNWGGLGSATVIPRFRRRGIHTALLQHRLHRAYQIGYELVVGGADFGSGSFRNQQRVGPRLGYIETVWKKLKS